MVIVECQKCGKEFNSPPFNIKRGKGKYCSKECSIKGRRIYKYNGSYFKEIDSPQKAYFLGFILGDGHISCKNRYLMRIEIHERDKLLLEQ